MKDLISRADAIEAVHKYFVRALNNEPHEIDEDGDDVFTDMKSVNALLHHNKYVSKALKELPSADAEQEAVPTVVRVTMSDGSQYYLEHEGDAIQAVAVQGEWKIDEYGIYHCPFCHAINNTVYKSFCPNCGTRMTPYKGGDDE